MKQMHDDLVMDGVKRHAIKHAERTGAYKRITAYARMCARSDLESFCRWNELDGHAWCDTSAIHPEDREAFIGEALWVLQSAGHLIAHPEHPHLVRIDIEKADRT
ncbi:hypothetical protein JN531_012110 [Flagellatimonas centrodinii]|uniref:hypothetical protein n=1 Tax=Flagellatimonas centrodinii TaxID=2806210 RepID=UPI001FEF7D67|nr:hypothetical protein [Flagellatimonas centrodinii]ULQ45844.1 hypothetical protein JN531_012110 [Flagellatimonas centrodinii]